MNALAIRPPEQFSFSALSPRERIGSISRIAHRIGRASDILRTHFGCHRHQPLPRHPQIRQCKQHDNLRGVLRQPAVSHLREAELALDHPKRTFGLRANARLSRSISLPLACFGSFRPSTRRLPGRIASCQFFIVDSGRLCAPWGAGVAEGSFFLAVQQRLDLRHVTGVCGRADHHVHKARLGACSEALFSMCVAHEQVLARESDPVAQFRALLGGELDAVLSDARRDFHAVVHFDWREAPEAARPELERCRRRYQNCWLQALRACHAQGRLPCDPDMAERIINGALRDVMTRFRKDRLFSTQEFGNMFAQLFMDEAKPASSRPTPQEPQ